MQINKEVNVTTFFSIMGYSLLVLLIIGALAALFVFLGHNLAREGEESPESD